MKTEIPSDPAENLIQSLCDDKARLYFGRGFALRVEVLAQIHAGKPSLYAIAKEYGVSHQAVCKIAKRARAIYATAG